MYYRGRVIFCSKHILINMYFKHIRASHGMEVPFINLRGKQSTQNCLRNCWILTIIFQLGKKLRFEQDQLEVGDKKKKNR